MVVMSLPTKHCLSPTREPRPSLSLHGPVRGAHGRTHEHTHRRTQPKVRLRSMRSRVAVRSQRQPVTAAAAAGAAATDVDDAVGGED